MISVYYVVIVFQRGRGRTKSNAAIFLLFVANTLCLVLVGSEEDVPTRRLCLTTRHVIFSGSFLETGVKKLATALSKYNVSGDHSHCRSIRFVAHSWLWIQVSA